MASSGNYAVVQSHGRNDARLRLGGAVVLAGLAPYAIALLVDPRLGSLPVFYDTLCAGLAAILAGHHFLRSLIAFPGIRETNYILPVVSSSFAAAVTVLFLLRLDYSRPLLVASYVIDIAWYYIIYFKLRRRSHLVIGVVPFGDVASLYEIDHVTWQQLESPAGSPSRYNAVVADFHADMPDEWERYLADAALGGVAVLHVRQLRESLTGRVEISHLSENANGSLVPQAAYFTPKFLVDVIVAATVLVCLSPLLATVALMIKATSPGPMLFQQQRIGYRGVPFRVWKFRTMTHRDGEAASAGSTDQARTDAITLRNDARITPLGRVLRRTRIDELPQLMNVVAGQMSFIGPRPEAVVLAQWYQQEIPFYRYRHIVRPGITGWAQVNQGHVADVEAVHSKLHYDFYYISNFSPWLDILIVLRTIRTVITGFGYR